MKHALSILLVACSNGATPADAGDDTASAPDTGPSVRTLVFRKMFAGDTDRAFKANATAWKTFGDDIDKTSGTSCTNSAANAEGDNGIDNAFGAIVLPLLMMNGFAIPSLQWSESIQQGAARPILVHVVGTSARVRVGALLPMAPDFSGQGSWAVSSLVNVDMDSTASAGTPVSLYIPYSNKTLVLKIHRFAFHLDTGTLSGVLDTNELVEAAHQATATCAALDAQIRAAQDIRLDGTNAGACDGISIGLGFETAVMAFGTAANDPGPQKGCP